VGTAEALGGWLHAHGLGELPALAWALVAYGAVGAALGLGALLTLGPGARLVVTAVLAGLNLAADLVSFSKVIRRTPALDRLDRLGRLRV